MNPKIFLSQSKSSIIVMIVFLTGLSLWVPWVCREQYLVKNPILASYGVPLIIALLDLTCCSFYKRYTAYEDRLEISYGFGIRPKWIWTSIFTPFRFIPSVIAFTEIGSVEKGTVRFGRRGSCYGITIQLLNGRSYRLLFEGSMPCHQLTELLQSKIVSK